jgi:mRNA interferase RelE/StbE
MQKSIKIEYSHVAEKEIAKLPKQIARRILSKVLNNASQHDVLARAKSLTGRFAGAYRYRIGDYRVVFVLDDKGNIIVLTVLSIKHRKDIYK